MLNFKTISYVLLCISLFSKTVKMSVKCVFIFAQFHNSYICNLQEQKLHLFGTFVYQDVVYEWTLHNFSLNCTVWPCHSNSTQITTVQYVQYTFFHD